jgi:deoxyribodipyrimidine photo-lyase
MIATLTLEEIFAKIDRFDPISYGKTRNYQDGGVSYLSPYLARGVISLSQVIERLLQRGFKLYQMESFLMELCWREHFQRLWQEHKPTENLRNPQFKVQHNEGFPKEVLEARTGIEALDLGIEQLYQTGYLHNHLRMYLASLICNHYQIAWQTAATWMHYHLKDADVASNHLSWQWVCGANSNKVYYANQENINKYTHSTQHHTALDVSYEQLPNVELEAELVDLNLRFSGISENSLALNKEQNACIYTPYNLDPLWHSEENYQRILFWDLEFWDQHPVSMAVFNWINELGKANLKNLQIFVGRIEELSNMLDVKKACCKEHPSTTTYPFQLEQRTWLLPEPGQIPVSFFPYWKKVQRQLQKNYQ